MRKMMHWMLSAAIRPLVLTMVFCGASVFNIDFGEGMTTSLSEESRVNSEEFATAEGWYTIDGRKLDGKPTKKGLYIHGGRKTVVRDKK